MSVEEYVDAALQSRRIALLREKPAGYVHSRKSPRTELRSQGNPLHGDGRLRPTGGGVAIKALGSGLGSGFLLSALGSRGCRRRDLFPVEWAPSGESFGQEGRMAGPAASWAREDILDGFDTKAKIAMIGTGPLDV